jgi:hypothetical protein
MNRRDFLSLCGLVAGLRLSPVTRLLLFSRSRHKSLVTRHNPLSRVRLAFCCLQNRLNELGQNYSIEICSW